MIFDVIAFVALCLSVYNTYIMLKYRVIKPRDIKDLLVIMSAIAKLTPTQMDDELVKKLRELLTRYERV